MGFPTFFYFFSFFFWVGYCPYQSGAVDSLLLLQRPRVLFDAPHFRPTGVAPIGPPSNKMKLVRICWGYNTKKCHLCPMCVVTFGADGPSKGRHFFFIFAAARCSCVYYLNRRLFELNIQETILAAMFINYRKR